MLRVGQEEIDAIARVIRKGGLFRYPDNGIGQCGLFEKRYAEYLQVKHVTMASSGTAALVAALAGLGVGPGDEVIVPCHTYMATVVAVLAVGAIPVIVDIDESITLCPEAFEQAIGPCTRAVIPVHMWGLPCNMDAIMPISEKHQLLVVEDACQAVGGAYNGRKLGSIGHAGAFSFNYFKNMTCGEGGAVATNDNRVAQKAGCSIDCCRFFWNPEDADLYSFSASGARASEIEGAMMNAQLDRLDPLIALLRRHKKRILTQTASIPGLQPNPLHSAADECGTHTHFLLPTPAAADEFATRAGGTVCGKTGRHTYTEWDYILNHRAGHHPAMNPFTWEANKPCRKNYSPDMCAKSLEILNRTVMIGNNVGRTDADVDAQIAAIRAAAPAVL